MTTDCIFCRIAAGEAPCIEVFGDDHSLAFMDIQPASPGHVLVIPRQHYETIVDITAPAMSQIAQTVRRVARAVNRAVEPDGMLVTQANRPAAGQTVAHYHTHIIPRTEGVRVRMHGTQIEDPEHLRELAARIADAIQR